MRTARLALLASLATLSAPALAAAAEPPADDAALPRASSDFALPAFASPFAALTIPAVPGLRDLLQGTGLGANANAGASDAEPAASSGSDGSSGTKTVAGAGADSEPWAEEANRSYHFLGLRGRYVVVPAFMFELYQADGGSTVTSPGIGLEYGVRRNGFEYDTWLSYSSFAMKESPFKAKSDPDQAFEIVRSELKVLSLGADFLWSTPIDKGFSFVYGGGAGLGVVFGNLYRNQAYPPGGVKGDPGTYLKCPAQGARAGDYCGTDNNHYGNYSEPSWFNGGSKPVVFPWISLPQIGVRWKPSRSFVLRFDTGLSFPGPFFFGLSGQYGLP